MFKTWNNHNLTFTRNCRTLIKNVEDFKHKYCQYCRLSLNTEKKNHTSKCNIFQELNLDIQTEKLFAYMQKVLNKLMLQYFSENSSPHIDDI